jgi:uncharacterized protein YecE (DUF72 family)
MGGAGEAQQERLFGGMPGEIRPPEPNLYLGTSGWSYADWEGTVYPPNTPSGARLAEYVKHYATVEIDSTFYGTPKRSTVERWRELAPDGFLFAAKFPREVTHENSLVRSGEATRTFVETMSGLGDRLGPLLVQLPPSFAVDGMGVLEHFLDELPKGPNYAVEVRHRSWLRSDLADMLREKQVALTLIDYPGMPRVDRATAPFSYIRWLGDRREFPAGHTHSKRDRADDLSWWAGVVEGFLSQEMTVFAYANNHYQNHSPSTLARFLELWRARR